jgi:hypothetical protein
MARDRRHLILQCWQMVGVPDSAEMAVANLSHINPIIPTLSHPFHLHHPTLVVQHQHGTGRGAPTYTGGQERESVQVRLPSPCSLAEALTFIGLPGSMLRDSYKINCQQAHDLHKHNCNQYSREMLPRIQSTALPS